MYESARYNYVYVNGKRVLEHVAVWEQAHGKKPKGCDIHHIDGNGKNNALENLVCLTKSEHKTLHAQLKREGRDVIDETDPAVIRSREINNRNAKAHRKANLEEERARDRAEYRKNHDRIHQRNHEFYERHKDVIKAKLAKYEDEHKEERSERNAKYYAEHTEERKQYMRDYAKANREKETARKRAYNLAHQDAVKAYKIAHRAVHAAEERLKRAIRNNLPEEVIAQKRAELAQAKEEFNRNRQTK